ncbi:MAG: 16S rRNA processing protein RimM [Alphaproteobacteria bacterium]|nr:16S rRNA processing protein RimM [Alphaproteobacteria bacterium]
MTYETQDICIGKIIGAHGVHGAVRVHVFSDDPESLFRYKKLKDAQGHLFTAKKMRMQKGSVVIVRFDGVSDRNMAEALRGLELFVGRDQMPSLTEDEFYINDLVGLKVQNLKGEWIGKVKAVENHGAGDFLSIEPFLKVCVPFTKAAIPEVYIRQGYLVLDESFLVMDQDPPSDV